MFRRFRFKRGLMLALGATVLAGGLSACAGPRHGWQGLDEADIAKVRERVLDKAGRELSLDEAQKARLAVLADALKAQRDALRAGAPGSPAGEGAPGAAMRAEFQSLLAGSSFDRSKAQAMIDARTAAVRDKSPAVVAAAGDFFDSLRPEQQQKLREWLARRGHGPWGRG